MSLDLLGEIVLLVFLCGDGEHGRLKFNGEPLRDWANRSLALVTVSSELSLADFAGECSRILVGFPGPIVMYVLAIGSSFEPRIRVPDTLLAARRRQP